MRRGRPRWLIAAFWCVGLAVAAGLASFGVTVVPDSVVASTDLNGNPAFDAKQLVDSIWTSRVLPLMQGNDVADAKTVLDAVAKDPEAAGAHYGHRPQAGDGPWNFIVRGQGKIVSASTQLRHATLTVDLGGATVTVQIGPVVFGSVLRDSLPFISFAQVVNQIQFAQVSRELNDRATASSREGVDLAQLKPGATVAFTGAMAAAQVTAVTLRVVTP